MNFFEGAAGYRCSSPVRASPGAASENPCRCSTCCRRCSISVERRAAEAVDGTQPAAADRRRAQPERTVYGEYLGEGAVAPILMIRRGGLKFVWCEADPPQLYDLAADPDELDNLAALPEHAATVAEFEAEVLARWDPAALRLTRLWPASTRGVSSTRPCESAGTHPGITNRSSMRRSSTCATTSTSTKSSPHDGFPETDDRWARGGGAPCDSFWCWSRV